MQSNKNVSTRHKNISKFCLIPCSHRPQITRQKNLRMNHLIQVKDKNQPNQCRHIINHPHFRLAQEESEEQTKQYEMYACMNKEQQVSEYQQAAKSAIEHAKEQERVHTAQKYIKILSDSLFSLSSDNLSEKSSDESSDSGTRQKPTKPVSSYNKSSTFQAKRKYDNEETPLKQPHHDAFTSKQEIL